MSGFKKHVGRLKNTDRRCVVVMTQIPGRDDHALVIDTDALPDRFHDALMQVIDSHEGQSVMELHTLLSRRVLPDLGIDILNALHNAHALQPQPIDNIIMFPQPHSPCPLSLIIEMQGKTEPITRSEQTILENRHLENQKVDLTDAQVATANNLLHQARDLENEAAKKREQAYRIAPTLRPIDPVSGTPVDALSAPEVVAADVAATPQTTVEEIASVIDISPEPDAPIVPFDSATDVSDLPADIADAYLKALEDAKTPPVLLAEDLTHEEDEDAAHAVDTSDDAIQAFLDKAAFREDKANKIATEAAEPKRPVGRPRKDGAPAGSKRG